MTERTNNNNETTTEIIEIDDLHEVLRDQYAFGFDLDARDAFLETLDKLITNIDIKDYDDNREDYPDFGEFIMQPCYSDDLFMWNSDAIEFIWNLFDDAADTLDMYNINPFREPNAFAWLLFDDMVYNYVDFEKLEAYVRQQA